MLLKESFKLSTPDSVPANLLEEMLLLIKTHARAGTGMRELLFKSKFILTELLTNAIKHSNSFDVILDLEVTETSVKFTKTDYGKLLTLPQIRDEEFKDALIITADVMHTLYALEKDQRIYFYCHEHSVPSINAEHDLPEHFGLLIITKAADEFYYYHDPADKANIFTAIINL